MAIPFTQYLMPDGRPIPVTIQMPVQIEAKAKELIARGFCFEIEMLSTGEIAMEVWDQKNEATVAMRICQNGPAVLAAVAELVEEAYIALRPENVDQGKR